jgi:RNA polymerase sigma factor (sigma-70 family)
MSLRHQEARVLVMSPEASEDHLLLDEQQARLLEGLRSLSVRQRDCLLLRFYLDLSERQIAETLAISPNSVKTHCRRGLAALRTMLEVAT